MNILDLVRKARPDVPEPEPHERERARAELLSAIGDGSKARPARRSWFRRRKGFLGLLAATAIPIGIAVAGSIDGEVSTDSTPPENCPVASAAFEAAGLPVPTEFGPDGCPSAQRLREWIATLERDLTIQERLDSAAGD